MRGVDQLAFGKAQPRKRFIEADLALRQRYDGLQVHVHALRGERVVDQGRDRGFGQIDQRIVRRSGFHGRGGGRIGRSGRRRRFGWPEHHTLVELIVVIGHRLGEFLDQHGEVADLRSKRFELRLHVGGGRSFEFRDALIQFADLAGNVGGGAGKAFDALVILQPVAGAGGNGFRGEETEQKRERGKRSFDR